MLAPERFWVRVTQLHPSTPGTPPPQTLWRPLHYLPAPSSVQEAQQAPHQSTSPCHRIPMGKAPPLPPPHVRGVASLGYTPPAIGGGVGWARNLAFQMCLATPARKDTGGGEDRRHR